jgi:hypothetical protein
MKLSPPLEEEEGFATRVVDDIKRPVVTGTVELGEEEYNTLAKVLAEDKIPSTPHDVEEMDVEITDDESKVGDDGDSAVGGIKRKRTVRVVIRSRAFL